MIKLNKDSLIKTCYFLLLGLFLCKTINIFAYFLTGSGHYGLRPEFRSNPQMRSGSSYFALNQSFRLLGEARVNEKSSFFAELRLFDNKRETRMGDSLESGNVFYPDYNSFQSQFSKFYINYVADYFVFEAGRRTRSWGQGLLYDDGSKPFSSHSSVYDGITFYLNPQQNQSLGFMAGYDLLSDKTALSQEVDEDALDEKKASYLHQFFGGIFYDTIKLKETSGVSSNTGLYFAHMFDTGEKDEGVQASLNFFDAYFNFLFRDISLEWKNELLGVWGKVAARKAKELGGGKDFGEADSLGSVSFATSFSWYFFESGFYSGPKEFNQGDYKRHVLFLDMVFVPGSSEGAKEESDRASNKAQAFKINENFKKTLILFNGKPELDNDTNVKVDGVFDPYRMMNVQLYSFGYRYEDLKIGNFEGKLSYARLNRTHDVDGKLGYSKNGNSLGFEVDFSYSIAFGKNVELGADLGILIPGDAWKCSSIKDPTNSVLAQGSVVFNL